MRVAQEFLKLCLMLKVLLGETAKVRARGHQLLLDLLLFHHHVLLLGVKDFWIGLDSNRNTRERRLQYASYNCGPRRKGVFRMASRVASQKVLPAAGRSFFVPAGPRGPLGRSR